MSVVIVTGAAGAIGRAIALEFARDGWGVLCVDRSDAVARVCEAVAALDVPTAPCVVDLTAPDAAELLVERSRGLGGPSVLINNAGITRDARALRMEAEAFRAVVRVNAVAPIRLAEGIAPHLPEGGAIVNMASRAALGNFGQANYVAAKSALIGATRGMALRWAPRLRVNAVAPGLVDTPMTAAMPPEVLAKLVERVPAGKAGTPEEIARVALFLGTSRAAYVTGQVLFACGGRSLAG